MSTDFTLGLARRPGERLQGMDKKSVSVCDMLQSEPDFPLLKRAAPDSMAWTARKPGVIVTVRYACERVAGGFEHLTGVSAQLLIRFPVDKTIPLGRIADQHFCDCARDLRTNRLGCSLLLRNRPRDSSPDSWRSVYGGDPRPQSSRRNRRVVAATRSVRPSAARVQASPSVINMDHQEMAYRLLPIMNRIGTMNIPQSTELRPHPLYA